MTQLKRLVCAALFLGLAVATGTAQQGKKVYISVDMEGISGINGDDQTTAGAAEYGRARKLMAEDANAAIRGAFEGGATDLWTHDARFVKVPGLRVHDPLSVSLTADTRPVTRPKRI